MCDFITPNLLLYTHIPVLITSALLGFFLLFSNPKNQVNKNIFIFILLFCLWLINDLAGWLIHNVKWSLLSARISVLEAFALLFFLFFSYSLGGTKISLKKKIICFIPFLPIVIFAFTNLNVYMAENDSCNNQNGILYYYVYFISIVYALWSVIVLLLNIKKTSSQDIKKQTKIVIMGISFVVVWFLLFVALSNYLAMANPDLLLKIDQFIPFGMLVFIGMLTYAITKYKMFNIKLLAAEALVAGLVILLFSEFFFVGIEDVTVTILISITILLATIFGIWLINSIRNEVKRKEELQSMSNSLATANDKLTKLDNAKSEFISIASHQLRTPLTAVKGFVSMMLEGSYGKLDAKQMDVLNKVYTSNERLIHLVEDLLDISRMESGRMEFKFAKTKIEDICQEVMDTFIIRAKESNLKLEYNPPKTPMPELMIDGIKIREVVSNLTDNAIKYTPKGGVVLRVELVAGAVRVIISDTGIGVPKTELPYLFSKFSRGKDVSRLNTGGTGLGLYVGKGIVEANGGKVWAESDGEGKGSRFIIELPVEQSKELLDRWG